MKLIWLKEAKHCIVAGDDFPVPDGAPWVDVATLPNKDYLGFYKYEKPTGTWVFERDRWIKQIVRPQRNDLLDAVDIGIANADRWDGYTAAQKKAIRDYKQALKDLPTTADPANLVFPTIDIAAEKDLSQTH